MAAYVRLLGAPAVRHDGGWLEPSAGKTSALLYYLAYQGSWVSRDDLIYLFWPDTLEQAARQNLRPLLYKLRRFSYTQELEVEATRLRWPVESDVKAFKQAASERNWPQAVNHYGGELLESFSLEGLPEFGSWLELERSELQSMWREAVMNFAHDLEATRRYPEAAQVLARLYKADSLDEMVLRLYLRVLYLSGERHQALEVFAAFKKTLEQEIGLEAEADTLQLVAHIKRGTAFEATDVGKVATAVQERHQLRIPLQATPFIGRSSEKTKLAAQLNKPACRLLSIVAPGGMGKTRLAIEVASGLREAFADGVVFAPFDDVTSPDFMVPALASALNFAFFGSQDPKEQLLAYLQDKEMLLVLDNLEHLLEGTRLISDMLSSVPNIKILATSRERLNLQAEWVFDLEGLAIPAGEATDLQDYDAVQLFLQAAQHSRADFTADDTSLQAITRICRLVEGMPLALELAAGWLRLLTVEEVADKLDVGIDFLEAPSRDMPQRHRSVRAVFEHSWNLLQPRERAALRKLSAFQGGFTLAAAEAVADVSLPLLLALINKSFLRRSRTGRFSRHPLIRQFVQERAQTHSGEQEQAEERHSAYFTAFLHAREKDLHTARGKKALAEITAEIENVEAAWRWAATHRREAWLEKALSCLAWAYLKLGWFERALELLRFAQTYIHDSSVLHGRLLGWTGGQLTHLRRFDENIPLLEQSVAILERHGAKAPLAQHLRGLGIAHARSSGTHSHEALEALQRALELYRELGDAEGITMMLHIPAYQAKEPEESERLLMEGVRLSRDAGLVRPLAMTLDSVAELLNYRTGDYPAAKKVMEDSLSCFAEAGEVFYRLLASLRYARIFIASGDDDAAHRHAQELLEASKTLEPGIAAQVKAGALSILARLTYLRGNLQEAKVLSEESYQLAGSDHALETRARAALAEENAPEAEQWLKAAWEGLEAHPMRGSFERAAAKITCLSLRGELASLQGQDHEAEKHFREALTLAHDWGYTPAALEALAGFSQLLYRCGDKEKAIELLMLVAEHTASTQRVKDKAQRALDSFTATPKVLADIQEKAGFTDIQGVIAELLL